MGTSPSWQGQSLQFFGNNKIASSQCWLRALAAAFSALFTIAFFTVHFGMFHLVHGVFLHSFFPVDGIGAGPTSSDIAQDASAPEAFAQVFGGMFVYLWPAIASYWPWLLVAIFAERKNLIKAWRAETFSPSAPYGNVVRMHLLILGIAFAVGAGVASIEGFILFALINLLYFFPWDIFGKNPRQIIGGLLKRK